MSITFIFCTWGPALNNPPFAIPALVIHTPIVQENETWNEGNEKKED